MAVNIGPKIGIDGEAEYRKQIQNIIQQTKTLKAEMNETESAFSKNTSAMQKAKEKAKNLTSQIEAQKTRVEQLNSMLQASAEKYGENDTKTLRWKQALSEANTELNNMETALRQIPWETITQIGDSISSVSQKIAGVGQTLTRNVTLPLVGVGAAGIKYISDFDTSMSKVQALAGTVAEDVSDSVIAMATETGKQFDITGNATTDAYNALEVIARQQAEVTKFTAAEAAEAMTYMALAGWDAQQMAEGLPGILSLAAASQMELAAASDIVTDQLTAFGLGAEDAAHFSDVLATAQARSNTTTEQMGEALKYVGSLAGSLNYTIEDVSFALGLMANSGVKASTAGTTLRNIMTRMSKPTAESAAAMDVLGISLNDGEGNLLSFGEILDGIREGMGNLKIPVDELQTQLTNLDSEFEAGNITESEYNEQLGNLMHSAYGAEGALKAEAAAQLAGARGMAGLLAIVNTAPDEYEALREALNNTDGAAENMAATMNDNLSGKLDLLKSKLGETAFQFLDGFMPTLEKGVEALSKLVDSFNSLDDSQKETILKLAGIAVAAGPVLSIIGKFGSGIGSIVSLVGNLGSGIAAAGGLIPAIAGLGSTLLPVIGIIAGVAAVIAGVVLVVKNWGAITEWLGGVWNDVSGWISQAATDVANWVSGAWEDVKEWTTDAWNNVKETVSGAWDNVKTGVKEAVDSVGNWVSDKWDEIKDKTSEKWEDIKNKVEENGGGIQGVILTVTDEVKGIWEGAFNKIDELTGGKLGEAYNTVKNKMEDIRKSFEDKLTAAREFVSGAIDKIKGFFDFSWELPKLKMPHFSITGKFSLSPPSIPKITVDWYKRAYSDPVMFTQPTVLGTSSGVKGFGDGSGGEIVIGQSMMYAMIRDAVQDAQSGETNTYGDINVIVNGAPGQDVNELAELVADKINNTVLQRRRAWA